MGESVKTDSQKNSGLTRQELRELESKEKTDAQRLAEKVILFFPNVCGLIAVSEYMLIPDNSMNRNPYTYLGFLILMMIFYNGYGAAAGIRYLQKDKGLYEKFRYRAPLWSALFLLFAGYDYLTLKTGILTQPFVPCMNFILNAAWDRPCHDTRLYRTYPGIVIPGIFHRSWSGADHRYYLWLFRKGPLLGRSGDQIFRTDPYIYLDPDHDGHCIFFIWWSSIYHCSWIMVCSDCCVHDGYCQCRPGLF